LESEGHHQQANAPWWSEISWIINAPELPRKQHSAPANPTNFRSHQTLDPRVPGEKPSETLNSRATG
jgi:hypothetical protein